MGRQAIAPSPPCRILADPVPPSLVGLRRADLLAVGSTLLRLLLLRSLPHLMLHAARGHHLPTEVHAPTVNFIRSVTRYNLTTEQPTECLVACWPQVHVVPDQHTLELSLPIPDCLAHHRPLFRPRLKNHFQISTSILKNMIQRKKMSSSAKMPPNKTNMIFPTAAPGEPTQRVEFAHQTP